MRFNQPQAAAHCGVSKHRWMRIEKLDYPNEGYDREVFNISAATGIDTEEIFPEELRGRYIGETFERELEVKPKQLLALTESAGLYQARSLLPAPEDGMEQEEVQRAIAKAVGTLSERQQEILTMAYGLGGGRPMNLLEIAQKTGISRSAIHQHQRNALDRLGSDWRKDIIAKPLFGEDND